MKNRIHATLAKYALRVKDSSDAFNKKGRKELELKLQGLFPPLGMRRSEYSSSLTRFKGRSSSSKSV